MVRDSKVYSSDVYGFVLGKSMVVEDLEIQGQRASQGPLSLKSNHLKLKNGLRKPGDICPDSRVNYEDLAWVIDPQRRVNAGPVLKEAVGGNPDPNLVAARLHLTEGDLAVRGFRDLGGGNIVQYKFEESGQREAVAEVVKYDFGFDDPLVEALLVTSNHADPLILHGNEINFVEVWLVNLPAADILELREPDPMAADVHFTEYYRLTGDSFVEIPLPVRYFCREQGVSNPKCPPALLFSFS
jgi:hypothetical protein